MNQEMIQHIVRAYKTPLYVFDIEVLLKRVQYLKDSFPSRVSLCYAMKSNPFLVQELEPFIEKFEVCSPGEYQICEEAGLSKEKLVISGVYKTPEVMEIMLKQSNIGIYTIESTQQFQLLAELSNQSQQKIRLLLRLTSGNQFGLDESELEDILKIIPQFPYLCVQGIQYFSGTQKTSIKRLQREITYLDQYIKKLNQMYQFPIRELEYGPGFPVFYYQEESFDEEDFFKQFSSLLEQMEYQGKVTLELGRSISASCGTYFTKVVDCKKNQGQNYAILDGGMHQLVYYGQMMAMKKPCYQLFPKREQGEELWTLCGSLCTINDLIVKQLSVGPLKVGDIFLFEKTGAYSMTEGISLFLSRDLPQVVFLKQGTLTLIRGAIPTYSFNMSKQERTV